MAPNPITNCVRKLLYILELATAFLLYYSGLLYLHVRVRLRKRIPIIFYHEVGICEYLPENISIPVDVFERQIAHIARWYNCIPLTDLHTFMDGAKDLPPNPYIIAFDGGYRGNRESAEPVLRRFGIPATIYIVTQYIETQQLPWRYRIHYALKSTDLSDVAFPLPGTGDRHSIRNASEKQAFFALINGHLAAMDDGARAPIIETIASRLSVDLKAIPRNLFLTWNEVRSMDTNTGIAFGSHSLTHPDLTTVSPDIARSEITGSKEMIERELGTQIDSFCYPRGDFSADIKRMVREAGYRSGTTVIYGLNDESTDPYELRRIPARNVPLPLFALEASGIYRAGTLMQHVDTIKTGLKRALGRK
ncbi:MAG: polysaccharide deacetylase family protein [bacterium]|nr:MAG: polysaccharide deacetylase family protein [bacterium]